MKMNAKTLSAVTLGSLLISIAVGLLVWTVTDESPIIVIWTALLIFGVILVLLSFMYSPVPTKFGPSDAMYKLVCGILAAMIGLIGMLYTFTDLEFWVLVAIFIIALAVTGIAVALVNGKREGQ